MKKSISIFIAIIFCTVSQLAAQTGNWYDDVLSYPELTEKDGVIEINSEEDLARLAYEVNGQRKYLRSMTFRLMKDLDLSAHYWTPIGMHIPNGVPDRPFIGTFDGNYKTISGLTIDDDINRHAVGLFGCFYVGASVMNLTLDNVHIKGKNDDDCHIGALVGISTNYSLSHASIKNCHVLNTSGTGRIEGAAGENSTVIGGLIGEINGYYTVTNCSNAVEVVNNNLSGSIFTGGLIGYASVASHDSRISACFNTGKITGSANGGEGIGTRTSGLIGSIGTNSGFTLELADSYNTGDITAGDFKGDNYAGGLIGYAYNGGTLSLTHCYAAGSINGKNAAIGGIAAHIWNKEGATDITGCVAIQTDITGGRKKNRIVGESPDDSKNLTLSNNWAFVGDDHTGWENTGHDNLGGESLPNADARHTQRTYDDTKSTGPGFDFDAIWFMPPEDNALPRLMVYTYADGNGSQANPFIIQTRKDLDVLSNAVNAGLEYTGKYFKLDPVDASGRPSDVLEMGDTPFTPIGTGLGGTATIPYFAGTFDGNHKTISGLTIDDAVDRGFTGLFGKCYNSVNIKNLTLDNVHIKGKNFTTSKVGALAGEISNYTAVPAIIENCHIRNSFGTSTIEGTSNLGSSYIGGLIGEIGGYYTVTHCSNAADIINDNDVRGSLTGGLMGRISTSTDNSAVTACFNMGKVSISDRSPIPASGCIGGIAGCIGINHDIIFKLTNCYNTGDISIGNSEGNSSVGGIVGSIYIYGRVSLINCYAAGSINGEDAVTGGIVGDIFNIQNTTTISNCLAIQTDITGTSANIHRILGKVDDTDGTVSLTNNYALPNMPGAPAEGWTDDATGRDGGNWTGSMAAAPVNTWAEAGWQVDPSGKLMPKLGIANEPDVPNPMYDPNNIGVSPLPEGDELWNGEAKDIRVYTISGRLVASLPVSILPTASQRKESITSHLSPLTSHLPKGVYLVVVGNTVTKVVL